MDLGETRGIGDLESVVTVEQMVEEEVMKSIDLVIQLLTYTKRLEDMVIDLRIQVNRKSYLLHPNQPIPYADLHSDVYETFDDHPAYVKHKKTIELYHSY